jgi:hypothetical protein
VGQPQKYAGEASFGRSRQQFRHMILILLDVTGSSEVDCTKKDSRLIAVVEYA